jgi:Eisosome protein 1
MADWANAAAVLANKSHLKNMKGPPKPINRSSSALKAKPADSGASRSRVGTASARAALLAHRSSEASHVETLNSEKAEQENIRQSHDRALLAATKSMGSIKIPEKKPVMPAVDQRESDTAHRRITARQQESQSRNKIIHIRREMLTEHPPIRMEVEEQKHQDALHASAVSLAKNVYSRNNQASSTTGTGHSTASDGQQKAKPYLSLQDAAQKMAAERLARIKDPDGTASLRNYYGYPEVTRSKSTHPKNLLQKVRHPLHHRTHSEGEEDATRSQHVRSQMALLQAQIDHVDSQKLADDRARLLAAAEKKVHQQMHKLDEKVFNETGKMSPAMMSEWDAKARARLQGQNQASVRETKPDSAVDVGAGKLVDRSEVEDLAIERVRPTLQGINEAVEKRRAEEAEQRAIEEERKSKAREEKERKRQEKAEKRKVHGTFLRLHQLQA